MVVTARDLVYLPLRIDRGLRARIDAEVARNGESMVATVSRYIDEGLRSDAAQRAWSAANGDEPEQVS